MAQTSISNTDQPRFPSTLNTETDLILSIQIEGHRAHTVFVGLHIPGSGVGSGKRHSHHRRHRRNGGGESSFEKNDFNLRPSEYCHRGFTAHAS